MKIFKSAIAILLITLPLLIQVGYAFGPPPPPDPGGKGKGPKDPRVPIDGGITFLIAAGLLYGSKKLYDEKKKK